MSRIAVEVDRFGSEASVSRDSRELVDLIRMRMDMLGEVDRALMKMYLESGCSFADIARVMGVSQTTASRRIRNLTRRLLDGRYVACMRNRERIGEDALRVARDHLIEGLSQPAIASKRRMTVYRVRKLLGVVRAVAKSDQ